MRERIVDHIRANGPMPFDEYMELCLYDETDGFFAAGPVRSGKTGDFVTSPELSWILSYAIGEWFDERGIAGLDYIGEGVALVEVGGGTGSLLRGLADPWVLADAPIFAVEKSSTARRDISALVPSAVVVSDIEDLPEGHDAVVVANELLDNMPAALARRIEDGWVEIMIDNESGSLMLAEYPARSDVSRWCSETFPEAPLGAVVSVQIAASEWIERLVAHLGTVWLCLIDYGAMSEKLMTLDPGSVVRSYRGHSGGLDWMQHPGETDITVDVNTSAVLKTLVQVGLRPRIMSQRDFVLAYDGGGPILDTQDREHLAAAEGRTMAQLQARSERLDMEALIDPNGLGAFQVILAE